MFSATLTDTLLRIAEEDAFRPYWSRDVLDELGTVLLIREAGLTDAQAGYRLQQMRLAFPDAEVAATKGSSTL